MSRPAWPHASHCFHFTLLSPHESQDTSRHSTCLFKPRSTVYHVHRENDSVTDPAETTGVVRYHGRYSARHARCRRDGCPGSVTTPLHISRATVPVISYHLIFPLHHQSGNSFKLLPCNSHPHIDFSGISQSSNMKYSVAAITALASTVSATAINLDKRASPLAVDLTPVSDTKVKVVLTNTGSTDYNLFYKGTFLDTDSPADKFFVSSAGKFYIRTRSARRGLC